jgi:hypothetical protein
MPVDAINASHWCGRALLTSEIRGAKFLDSMCASMGNGHPPRPLPHQGVTANDPRSHGCKPRFASDQRGGGWTCSRPGDPAPPRPTHRMTRQPSPGDRPCHSGHHPSPDSGQSGGHSAGLPESLKGQPTKSEGTSRARCSYILGKQVERARERARVAVSECPRLMLRTDLCHQEWIPGGLRFETARTRSRRLKFRDRNPTARLVLAIPARPSPEISQSENPRSPSEIFFPIHRSLRP